MRLFCFSDHVQDAATPNSLSVAPEVYPEKDSPTKAGPPLASKDRKCGRGMWGGHFCPPKAGVEMCVR
jgi:hypothetical protein